ncbi:alpha/beta hydrolase family protein [Haloarcula litorea]|uniref:S9 family peptidase n=1 Tax=Haloarcula litorea TaxID=3032579 RepID=UPI0023E79B69|nr:S9 family peptidase [Halomicroarcula sp. GDY20]
MTGRPIEAADFHDVAVPEDPRLSPDGDRVAFVKRVPTDEESYERTVHVVPSDGGATRRFTLAEGEDAEPRWSPSGDRLAFTSTRGADDDRQQLWVLPTDGGEARQVTDVVGGVSSIEWSPDGTQIAFLQRVTPEDRENDRDRAVPQEYEPEEPDPRVIDRTVYRTAERYFDGARPQAYVVSLADDEVERVTDCDHDHASPTFGDAETLYVAAHRVGEDPDDDVRYDIVAHDLAAGDSEQVHRSSGWAAALTATEDGRVAHLHSERERVSMQPVELHVYDRTSETVHDVTAPLDRTLGLDAAPVWGPDGETLYFTTPDEGATAVWEATGDGSGEPERLFRGGSVDGLDAGEDAVAVTRSEADHPGDVFLVGDDGDRRLTHLNADYLEEVAVGEPEPLTVESEQGRVEGWVLTPPGFEDGDDGEHPLVVEVHGGPHAMWTASGTMWHEFQTLAARGYVVAWANPRGSTGYGEAFMQAIERDWGEVTLTDVLAVAEAVADRESVDADEVFLTGGSFGGYLTSWAVGHTDRFRAAVAQRGVYDLTGFYGSTDGAYKLVEGDFDATPWDDPEFLWDHSPVAHADAVDTPTLLLHSDRDYRTPANTAELFHRGLRKHGVDTRLVRYPREGHELSRSGEPGHVVDRIERIARWFDGYSDHRDAARALDRPDEAGLSAGEDPDDEGSADESDG